MQEFLHVTGILLLPHGTCLLIWLLNHDVCNHFAHTPNLATGGVGTPNATFDLEIATDAWLIHSSTD